MKTIKVAAAIIKKDNKILIASRKTGEFAGMFEFPGGKVEPGETSKQALIREIQEELETSINIDEFFMNVNYTYPTFILDMDCFICSLKDEQITLNVHDSIKWITSDQQDINWIPADIQIIEKLKERGI
ncbi:MAG: (deoxy)nucleoside triphosphate pyrophosphohydrolase [Thomasclavelia spiroformis]